MSTQASSSSAAVATAAPGSVIVDVGAKSLTLVPCVDSPEQSSVILLIPDVTDIDASRVRLREEIAPGEKTYAVVGQGVESGHVEQYAELIEQQFLSKDFKRVTLVGIGRGANVAQAVAIVFPRIVRRVILVNATTRLAPSKFVRMVDRIERFLPLGLPMRSSSTSFDSRPYLHRVRCPALVLTTPSADSFVRAQADTISQAIPNAWRRETRGEVSHDSEFVSSELTTLIREFLDVPPKRPQKNLARAARQ